MENPDCGTWDTNTGRELARHVGHVQGVEQLTLAPSGKSFATARHDNTVRIWDVARQFIRLHSALLAAAATQPKQDSVASPINRARAHHNPLSARFFYFCALHSRRVHAYCTRGKVSQVAELSHEDRDREQEQVMPDQESRRLPLHVGCPHFRDHFTFNAGRRRGRMSAWLFIGIFVVLIALVCCISWLRGAGVPDRADPFDLQKFGAVDVNPQDNAFTEYKRAAPLLVKEPRGISQDDLNKALEQGWEAGTPRVRQWVADNRPALNVWREGTAKPEAIYYQPKDMRVDTLLDVVTYLREFARLARLEGARLETEGKPAEAWAWYRATIRGSRHCGMHGGMIERLVGVAMHTIACRSINRWAARADVDRDMLRQAIANMIADDKLTAPPSTALKVEYLIDMQAIEHPEQLAFAAGGSTFFGPAARLTRWFKGEPELSRRLAKHLFANLLAQVDKPRWARAKTHPGELLLYEQDAGGATSGLSAEEIQREVNQSVLARKLFASYKKFVRAVDRERAEQACLIVLLAAQAYCRDHGKLPETAQVLVPDYTRALPDDPFGKKGERLHYRRDARGAVVWSVGPDGTDNGGKVTAKSSDGGSLDTGFESAGPER